MSAWLGSDDLTAALASKGEACGCEQIQQAQKQDPQTREAWTQSGRVKQQRWGCPAGGFTPPSSLTPAQSAAIDDVGRVTGAPAVSFCRTCPMFYADAPWVRRVLTARTYLDKGSLDLVEPKPIEAGLVLAIEFVESALAARQRADYRRAMEEHERNMRKTNAGGGRSK